MSAPLHRIEEEDGCEDERYLQAVLQLRDERVRAEEFEKALLEREWHRRYKDEEGDNPDETVRCVLSADRQTHSALRSPNLSRDAASVAV